MGHQFDDAVENAFPDVNFNAQHIDMQIIGNDLGNFIHDADPVIAGHLDRYPRAVTRIMTFPLHINLPVTEPVKQLPGIGTVFPVDGDPPANGHESKDLITWLWLAAFSQLECYLFQVRVDE